MKRIIRIDTGWIKMFFTLLFICLVCFCSYKLFTSPDLAKIAENKKLIYETKAQMYVVSVILGMLGIMLINFNFHRE